MRFFKYLLLSLTFFSSYTFAYTSYTAGANSGIPAGTGNTPESACQAFVQNYNTYYANNNSPQRAQYLSATTTTCNFKWALNPPATGYTQSGSTSITSQNVTCPSAQEINLKVALNAQTYQCVQNCQYRLTACVDVDFEAGMTCTAISTGLDCGSTPPPTNTTGTTTPDTGTPATPNQSSSGTNTNTATTTGTSTSTSTSTATSTTENNTTTTNTTTTTTTTNNTTTTIDLSSLETTIKSIGSILGSKLDALKDLISDTLSNGNSTDLTQTNQKLDDIKNNGQKTNNWLQGKNDDGTGGGISENPFGTDQTPEKALTAQDLETNIFVGSATCPADRTLTFQLFTGKTFSKSFSFSMWCDKLTIFGTLILIASYLYAAYIITSKS